MRSTRNTDATTPLFVRLAAVLVATALLVCVPGIAQARFTGTASSTGTTVGTLSLPAPTGASVTAGCNSGWLVIYVNSYGTVPRATSYQFTVIPPTGPSVQPSSGLYYQNSPASGVWTYQIQGVYKGPSQTTPWTGQPYTGTVTC